MPQTAFATWELHTLADDVHKCLLHSQELSLTHTPQLIALQHATTPHPPSYLLDLGVPKTAVFSAF